MSKKFCILGAIFALGQVATSLYFLFCELSFKSGGYLKDASFGGEYYTYQYKATYVASENVENVGYYLQTFFTYFTIIIAILGVVEFCYFMIKMNNIITQSVQSTAVTEVIS